MRPLAAGALYWEAENTLLVADLHLEKGAAFAALGMLIPPYDTRTTLQRLGKVIRAVWEDGGRFDGWSEHFSYDRWMDSAARALDGRVRISSRGTLDRLGSSKIMRCRLRKAPNSAGSVSFGRRKLKRAVS